jgi:hypothetical protein
MLSASVDAWHVECFAGGHMSPTNQRSDTPHATALIPAHSASARADVDIAAALADVVDALTESVSARLDQWQTQAVRGATHAAGRAAVDAIAWSSAVAALVVAWTCAHVALALWVSATHGAVTAALAATLIHLFVAALLVAFAWARRSRS